MTASDGGSTRFQADFAEARQALPAVMRRLATLVAGLPDLSVASPCPPWSVGDVAAHVGLAYLGYSSIAAGRTGDWSALIPDVADPIARLKGMNDRTLAMVGAEGRGDLGPLLAERLQVLLDATEGRDPAESRPAPWFGDDVRIPLGTVTGLLLSESLLHGLDIARGAGRPWPIDKRLARLVISLVFPTMMPLMLKPAAAGTLAGSIVIHARGGIAIGVRPDGGAVRIEREPADGRADCHISVDPVAFLLTSSGRLSQGRAIAGGKMFAYGRRPWLAPSCARLFSFP